MDPYVIATQLADLAIFDTVRVKVMHGEDDFDVKEYPLQEIVILRRGKKKPAAEQPLDEEMKSLLDE